jgi:DNA-binding NtrC family response regulator
MIIVELVRLYSNLSAEADHLRRVRSAASSPRPVDGHERPRQHQRRLSMTEVTKLISAYEQQASVKELAHKELAHKELAQQFGIHRTTVTALLQRHGVELRHSGPRTSRGSGGRKLVPTRLDPGAIGRDVRR